MRSSSLVSAYWWIAEIIGLGLEYLIKDTGIRIMK